MKIITICGSTRFKDEHLRMSGLLTLKESAVVFLCSMIRVDEPTDEQIKLFDIVHKRKIELSDEIFILDVDGYIGESTRNEIAYASELGKTVRYLSKECWSKSL